MKKLFGISASVVSALLNIVILALVSSCATKSAYDANKFYKKDIKLKVNGQSGTGMMVIKKAPKYKIDVEKKGNIDLFV